MKIRIEITLEDKKQSVHQNGPLSLAAHRIAYGTAINNDGNLQLREFQTDKTWKVITIPLPSKEEDFEVDIPDDFVRQTGDVEKDGGLKWHKPKQ